MKKFLIPICSSVVILAFLFFINSNFNKNIQTIELQKLYLTEAKETVTATGYFENIGGTKIEYKLPIFIKNISVNEGDYVKEGDALFSIDREKTVDSLINGGYSVFSSNSDYSLITKLPSEITAPKEGYVSDINYKSNSIYDTLNPIMTISKKDDICAVLEVSEELISTVKKGQSVRLKSDGISNSYIYGKVNKISDSAKQTISEGTSIQRVVNVIVNITSGDIPKRGFSVEGNITISKTNQLLLPYDSILQDDEGEYVYFADSMYATKTYIETKKDFSKGSSISEKYEGKIIVRNPEKLKSDRVKLIV